MNPTADPAAGSRYQLWFRPLSNSTTAPRVFRCDASGCIAKLGDGRLVSVATAADAFEEDCRRTALVVTTRNAPPACDAGSRPPSTRG